MQHNFMISTRSSPLVAAILIGWPAAILAQSGCGVDSQHRDQWLRPGAYLDSFYQLGPDSLPQHGVPKGKLVGPLLVPSHVFPGHSHTFFVYVPAQYDPAKPAALTVFNDGQAFMAPDFDVRAPNVLDNLIWRREIPVMIGVFINPGKTPQSPEPNPKDWGDRTTIRDEEYQQVNDRYARVLADELIPAVARQYNISRNPDDHLIVGASSGGIAAFSAAWERPDAFHKVISIVGSFTDILCSKGSSYPEKVLTSAKKPLRVFFQDGVNDNRVAVPQPQLDWHIQNQRLLDALTDKGYDVSYTWGIGLHGMKQGGAILPEMMRWIWRDFPRDDAIDRDFPTGR
jgi:enterochelin esterase-like enzyme